MADYLELAHLERGDVYKMTMCEKELGEGGGLGTFTMIQQTYRLLFEGVALCEDWEGEVECQPSKLLLQSRLCSRVLLLEAYFFT